MKKIFIVLLLLVMVSGLALAGCTTSTTPQKVTELRLSTQDTNSERGEAYKKWAGEIEAATNGEVKITVYSSSTLVGEEDILSGLKSGLADLGDVVLGILAEQFPLHNILQMPFLCLGDKDNYYKILVKLEDKFPEMKAEYTGKNLKLLYISGFGDGGMISTTKKPVKVPADIKGLQIMSPGLNGKVMASIGASPVFMPLPEWYTSLERGLLDGMQMPWMGLYASGVYPLLPYNSIFPSVAALGIDVMAISDSKWNELSPKAQREIENLSADMTETLMQIENKINEEAIATMKKEGHTFIMITPDEEKLWFAAAQPIHKEYLAGLDAKGLPATAIYEEALKLAK